MYEHGKSDGPVIPAKLPDKAVEAAAEAVEERGPAEGNTDSTTHPGRSAGHDAPSGLDRVREVARRDKDARFTALLHHVSLERLVMAYWALSPKASPGVDGVTWADYGQDLVANLRDLHDRVHSGRYRAKPSRRAYIPKADGRLRPLGIAALEDKIVQRAVVEVLNAIYEADFLGFSYGFRPGRGPHDALDALAVGIERKKVNWVLDADIRDFFGQLDRDWLRKFPGHRIADKRILRLIDRWLAAGVIENGTWTASERGSPQGASVTPPTQWITSASRSRWVIAGWNGHGVSPATCDMSGSTFMAWLVTASVRMSMPSASMPQRIWWSPACRWPMQRASWPGSSGALCGRPAGMRSGPRSPAGWSLRRPPRCSRSSCRPGWQEGFARMPATPGSPSPRSWRRRWRNSWPGAAETIRAGEQSCGRGAVRLRPPCWRGSVGGLRHSRSSTAGPHRAVRPGRTAA